MGFLINLSLPLKPMYFDRQPEDHKRTRNSTPKKVTRKVSWNFYVKYWIGNSFVLLTIQYRWSSATLVYSSIVDNTLKIRQINTDMNLINKRQDNSALLFHLLQYFTPSSKTGNTDFVLVGLIITPVKRSCTQRMGIFDVLIRGGQKTQKLDFELARWLIPFCRLYWFQKDKDELWEPMGSASSRVVLL